MHLIQYEQKSLYLVLTAHLIYPLNTRPDFEYLSNRPHGPHSKYTDQIIYHHLQL